MDKLLECLKSEEGKKSTLEYFDKIFKKEKFYNEQVERFYQKYKHKMPQLIEQIMQKYESDVYIKREYKRGFEPRKKLYDVLLKIAAAYGVEVDLNNIEQFPEINDFTAIAYTYEGYFLQLMIGQGSVIRIDKL